jgi:hypothetical protein
MVPMQIENSTGNVWSQMVYDMWHILTISHLEQTLKSGIYTYTCMELQWTVTIEATVHPKYRTGVLLPSRDGTIYTVLL